MLQIPAVHVVELLKIQILTGDDPDGPNCGCTCSEQYDVPNRDLLRESTDKSLKREIM